MQSITGASNDMGTCIGVATVADAEKAGWNADSVQSVENRKSIYSLKFSVKLNIKCRSKVKRSSD